MVANTHELSGQRDDGPTILTDFCQEVTVLDMKKKAELVTGDPEFEPLEREIKSTGREP